MLCELNKLFQAIIGSNIVKKGVNIHNIIDFN